jgi:hypothetical protein
MRGAGQKQKAIRPEAKDIRHNAQCCFRATVRVRIVRASNAALF